MQNLVFQLFLNPIDACLNFASAKRLYF